MQNLHDDLQNALNALRVVDDNGQDKAVEIYNVVKNKFFTNGVNWDGSDDLDIGGVGLVDQLSVPGDGSALWAVKSANGNFTNYNGGLLDINGIVRGDAGEEQFTPAKNAAIALAQNRINGINQGDFNSKIAEITKFTLSDYIFGGSTLLTAGSGAALVAYKPSQATILDQVSLGTAIGIDLLTGFFRHSAGNDYMACNGTKLLATGINIATAGQILYSHFLPESYHIAAVDNTISSINDKLSCYLPNFLSESVNNEIDQNSGQEAADTFVS